MALIKVTDIAKTLSKKMIFLSDTCEVCKKERKRTVRYMKINDEIVCPVCKLAEDNQKLEAEMNVFRDEKEQRKRKSMFYDKSLIKDETIKLARFSTFKSDCEEDENNYTLAKRALEDYLDDVRFNLILVGKVGAGKSHLAYSIAHEMNENSTGTVLYVSVSELFDYIRSTFNGQSEESEHSIVNLLVSADLLVIDDLGAELGDMDAADPKATAFVNRVLFKVFDGRQGKKTIVTTNLTGEAVMKAYDERITSRMFNTYRHIEFKFTRDKRKRKLPF
ncbi:ATP-binding protein [Bacillus thuringiensis]|uniref:ATP-binding protein n=1 Tax=Bacillus thuringiensis TaxID=1428 RepID=UPI00301891B1